MLWSAFTLAFYGFLRSSEFTAPSATQFNPLVHLSNSDVSFNSGGCLTLHLKSCKTDPYRQGYTLLIAPSHRSVCTVRALKKYLSMRFFNSTSPLYVFQSGNYLTRAKVTSILRTIFRRLGMPTELHSSHSFRIGAETTAAEAGLPPWLIQTLGRWSSNCFTLYIRTPPSVLQKVPSMLASQSSQGHDLYIYKFFLQDSAFAYCNWQYLGYYFGCTPATSLACCRLGGALAPPQLSLTHGWGRTSLVGSSILCRVCRCHPCCVTYYCQGVLLPPLLCYLLLLGCVAATLVALLIITRVCRCHPYCLHLQGVLLPPSIYAREHPMSLVPFTAKDCVVYLLLLCLATSC